MTAQLVLYEVVKSSQKVRKKKGHQKKSKLDYVL